MAPGKEDNVLLDIPEVLHDIILVTGYGLNALENCLM